MTQNQSSLANLHAVLQDSEVPFSNTKLFSDGVRALESVVQMLEAVRKTAEDAVRSGADSEVSWEVAYSLVFSGGLSRKFLSLCEALLLPSFDYYDPDASYQDDVTAFIDAAVAYMAQVRPFLNQFANNQEA